jgi:Na+/glutamate symporter
MITLIFAVNPSVSLAADSLSLRLGHGAAGKWFSFLALPLNSVKNNEPAVKILAVW